MDNHPVVSVEAYPSWYIVALRAGELFDGSQPKATGCHRIAHRKKDLDAGTVAHVKIAAKFQNKLIARRRDFFKLSRALYVIAATGATGKLAGSQVDGADHSLDRSARHPICCGYYRRGPVGYPDDQPSGIDGGNGGMGALPCKRHPWQDQVVERKRSGGKPHCIA